MNHYEIKMHEARLDRDKALADEAALTKAANMIGEKELPR